MYSQTSDWDADLIEARLTQLHLSLRPLDPPTPVPEWNADAVNSKLEDMLQATLHSNPSQSQYRDQRSNHSSNGDSSSDGDSDPQDVILSDLPRRRRRLSLPLVQVPSRSPSDDSPGTPDSYHMTPVPPVAGEDDHEDPRALNLSAMGEITVNIKYQ
jgi:hypothetical protein